MFSTLLNPFWRFQATDLAARGVSIRRSPKWPKTRKQHFLIPGQEVCCICGYAFNLNVHHILPFHLFPELELLQANLITLGEKCPSGNHHFLFGHFLNWKKFNPGIVAVAASFLSGISPPKK